jgi:hypothetical protein
LEADMEAFVYTLVGILVGGLITFVVSRHYYQRASQDLQTEAEDLRQETREARHYVNALITYLESAGLINVTRDQDGKPREIHFIYPAGGRPTGGAGKPGSRSAEDPP